ncbi:MAG: LysM peptidoglycan-binding domain-containing protein [Candidatus Hydrogenedentota bacterium]
MIKKIIVLTLVFSFGFCSTFLATENELSKKVEATLKKLEELNKEVQALKEDIAKLKKEAEDTNTPFIKTKTVKEKKTSTLISDDSTIEYIVKPGDTLSKIAQDHYGKSSLWKDILEINKDIISSPQKLRAGMKIRLYRNEAQRHKGTE